MAHVKGSKIPAGRSERDDPQVWTSTQSTGSTLLLALILALAVLALLHGSHRVDSDEGVILNGAWNLLHGQALYTDFFEFVAPGAFYLVYVAWRLVGPEFWVAKVLGMAAILASAAGVYQLGRWVLGETKAAVHRHLLLIGPLLLCLSSGCWPTINHNTFNSPFMIWGAYFVARASCRPSRPDALVAGLLCGLAATFLQHRGALLAATALTLLLYWAITSRDWRLAATAAVFLAAAALPIAGMLLVWRPALLMESLIDFPANHYLAVNWVDPSVLVLAVAIAALAGWLLRGIRTRTVAFLLSLQAVLLVSALQRPDLSHTTASIFPLLALVPLLLSRAADAQAASKAIVLGGLMLLAGALPFNVPDAASTADFFRPSTHPAIAYVRDNCSRSRYIYAGPFIPGAYYETGKLNASKYSVLLTGLNTDRQFGEAREKISELAPECAITNYAVVEKFGYDRANTVDTYLAHHYQVVFEMGRTQVWRLRARAPAGGVQEDPAEGQ